MSKAYSDLILQDAIEYLNKARVCIEAAARERAKSLPADCGDMDLLDVAEDLGPLIYVLEGFAPPKPEPVENMYEIVLQQPAQLYASVQVKARTGSEAAEKAYKIATERTLNWEVDWDSIDDGNVRVACDPDECEIG